jgi:hypothetical protein
MRILMLVLTGGTDPIYKTFEALWQRYMRTSSEVDCYLYKGDPQLKEEYVLDPVTKVLTLRVPDDIEHTFEKMVKAFQYFEPHFQHYNFVYRTNLSSFLVLERYLAYCSTIREKERFCSAVVGHDGHTFPSGSGFTITPDVAKYVIKRYVPTHLIDDVALGNVLIQGNVPIRDVPRADILDHEVPPTALTNPSFFHFRIKSNDRFQDVKVYESLLDHFYQ